MSVSDKTSHLWIKDLKENDQISDRYLVKIKRQGLTKKGAPFLSLTLADRTGDIEARVWEKVEELSPLFGEGDVLEIRGYASSYRNQLQLTLSNLRLADDGGSPELFLEATPKDVAKMTRSLCQALGDIKNPDLKALVDRFLADRRFMASFKKAPAAKNFHHNYLGGLLEHTLSVCEMVEYVSEHYPELDRDLLLTGGFLHDIGKVKELMFDRHIDYTDEGRLLGHLSLGVSLVDEKLADLKAFPEELEHRVKHLILSHHGEYEFGSPKRPKFLEAFALHFIDDLDAKINGLGRFMEKDHQEGVWTDFNRLFERYFLKGRISGIREEDEPESTVDDRQKALFPG